MFKLTDRDFGMFIIEDLGSEEGMSHKMMRRSAIENAASGSKMIADKIPTFGIESGTFGNMPGETISYAVKFDNLPIVFTNTVIVDKHRTIQVVTYAIGQALTDEMKANHKGFLEATRFN